MCVRWTATVFIEMNSDWAICRFDNPSPASSATRRSLGVSESMPETVDAADLQRRNAAGEWPAAIVQGPLSFDLAYATMAAQRNSKILGIFVRLDRRDGKPQYLKLLPRIRDYLKRALAHPELVVLRDLYVAEGFIDA